MYIRVAITGFKFSNDPLRRATLHSTSEVKEASGGKSYCVYEIEVVTNSLGGGEAFGLDPFRRNPTNVEDDGVALGQGRFFRLEKRYSSFLSLHNELRRRYRTPVFPPKTLRNTTKKVLEQRRHSLEQYLQQVVKISPLPPALLEFLEVRKHYHGSATIATTTSATSWTNVSSKDAGNHLPVVGFLDKEQFLFAKPSRFASSHRCYSHGDDNHQHNGETICVDRGPRPSVPLFPSLPRQELQKQLGCDQDLPNIITSAVLEHFYAF